MVNGNKGEWSELYALLKILAEGKVYCADSDLKKEYDVFFPIMEVSRTENQGVNHLYVVDEDEKIVKLYRNDFFVKDIEVKLLGSYAKKIYEGILKGDKTAFYIEGANDIMQDIESEKLKAPSNDKTDIRVKIHDIKTGFEHYVGYSIKSNLGNPPTLLNASKSTNFKYKVDIPEDKISIINSINTKSKVRDRIGFIRKISDITFVGADDKIFLQNLMLIDSMMEKIIGYVLLEYYNEGLKDCLDLAESLERKDPLNYGVEGIYRYKLKKLLSAIALGMVPSKKWNGKDEANGGYMVVKENGEIVVFHLYNRDEFEDYLLKNTRFETPSTGRHKFAEVYIGEDGCKYINLNLQIRFK